MTLQHRNIAKRDVIQPLDKSMGIHHREAPGTKKSSETLNGTFIQIGECGYLSKHGR